MKINLTYVTDNKGKQKAIQMPIEEWNRFYYEYQKLAEFKKIKVDLTDAMKEIKLYESGKKKPKTLKQFLNDL